ncbi:MAG: DUF4147 domain-containing protein [Hoeflea sp. D1-CHI-28]
MLDDSQCAALRERALCLYRIGVEAARPGPAVARALSERRMDVSPPGRCHVVAIGKAAGEMMRAALDSLPGDMRGECLVITNYENDTSLPGVDVRLAGHPVPDGAGLEAGREVERLARSLGSEDVLLCLISGGGSALLPAPVEGLTLDEKVRVNELLLASGADIRAMNLVRQSLSRLKGGGLLRRAAPARVVSLILSDVIGDDLSVVASGPTVTPIGSRSEAVETLHMLGIWDAMPLAARHVLLSEEPRTAPEQSDAHLIGSNAQSLRAIREAAGSAVRIVDGTLIGPVEEAARKIAEARRRDDDTPILLFGGETTVRIRGTGQGGRNQELALRFALEAERLGLAVPWVFLSGGTDGRDGPTTAAGGCVDHLTLERIRRAGGDVGELLAKSDSFRALELSKDLIPQWQTGTNVADVQVLLRPQPAG